MDELNAIASLYSKNASKSSDGTVLIEGRILTNSEQVAVDAEVIRLQAEFDAQAYARDRRAEYDALNQLEMQFDDKEDGTTTWEDAIKAIKTKYPKP
jgi:hypothetical protein